MPPSRYLVYVAGALSALLVATGVGAAAAFVVEGNHEQVTNDSSGPAVSETTEGTAVETPSEADNRSPDEASSVENTDEPTGETVYVHTASALHAAG